MTEKTMDWNLAFTADEVIAGVEKLLVKLGYACARSEEGAATVFHLRSPRETLTFAVRPLTSYRSPFNSQAIIHRTLLTVTYAGFTAPEEEALKRGLTLTFLRVGG